jgi:hypothetical protein
MPVVNTTFAPFSSPQEDNAAIAKKPQKNSAAARLHKPWRSPCRPFGPFPVRHLFLTSILHHPYPSNPPNCRPP